MTSAKFGMCGILAATLAFAARAAHAQTETEPEDNREEIIMGAWANPDNCNINNAIRMDFRQAISREPALNGSCVAIEGFWRGRALFLRDRDARRERSNTDRALRQRRIGLYGRNEILENAPDDPQRFLMVGVMGQCETQWPDAMMVMGYCHYTGGPILLISEAHDEKREASIN